MISIGIFSSHIQKLGHPIREIRERGFHQLQAKLKCGFAFDDEESRTRELLDYLFRWFDYDQITYQKEVFNMILSLVKSAAGSKLMKTQYQEQWIKQLESVKDKIDTEAMDAYKKVLDLLHFVGNVRSDVDLKLPELQSISESSLNSEKTEMARETLTTDSARSKSSSDGDEVKSRDLKCIAVYLLPWAYLNDSDLKTLTLMEDTLQVVKSTQKCCRFILHVFLRDFPAEVFLNRPSVVHKLESLIESEKGGVVVEVLLAISKAIDKRIEQMFDPAFKTSSTKLRQSPTNTQYILCTGGAVVDCSDALKQLPVPLFCLKLSCNVLASFRKFSPTELNTMFDLLEANFDLLCKCVSSNIWEEKHESKIYRDIVQMTYSLLKCCGDVLNELRSTNPTSPKTTHSRVNAVRMTRFVRRVLKWRSNDGSVGVAPLPNSLVLALEDVLCDVAMSASYPELVGDIVEIARVHPSCLDPNFLRRHREVTQLCHNIDHVSRYFNLPNKKDPNYLTIILESLPAFELHQSPNYAERVVGDLFELSQMCEADDEKLQDARKVLLFFMAHDKEWVKELIYKKTSDIVTKVTTKSHMDIELNENCLNLIFDARVLTEICCHGLVSSSQIVHLCSKELLLYLLRSKLVISDSCWRRFIATLIPIMSLLDCHTKRGDVLGDALVRMLDSKIAECMLIPRLEILRSNIRVFFNKCYSAQMDAAHNFCKMLCYEDDCDNYLPTSDCIRADILVTAIRNIEQCDFNVIALDIASSSEQQTIGLTQILDILTKDIEINDPSPLFEGNVAKSSHLDPAFRRNSLSQLAVIMRDPCMHSIFCRHKGLEIICVYLRLSLRSDDYTAYPDCAISCLSILNSLCATDPQMRHTLSKNQTLYHLVVRAILVHPLDNNCCVLGAQILFILTMCDVAVWSGSKFTLPRTVVDRVMAPIHVEGYWDTSINAVHNIYDWVKEEKRWRSYVCMYWVCSLNGGADQVRKWPCIIPDKHDFTQFLNISEEELSLLKLTCSLEGSRQALYRIQNTTTHKAAEYGIALLTCYASLLKDSNVPKEEYSSLPWSETFANYCTSLPSSNKDIQLLMNVIKFMHVLLDYESVSNHNPPSWLSTLLDTSDTIYSIVEKEKLFPESYDTAITMKCRTEVARLIARLPSKDSPKMLLRALKGVDCTQFSSLVFLNELVRSIRCVIASPCDIPCDILIATFEALVACSKASPQVSTNYSGYKGVGLLLNVYLCYDAIMQRLDFAGQPVEKCEVSWQPLIRSLVCGCLCVSVSCRAAAISVLTRTARQKQTLCHIEQGFETEALDCIRYFVVILLEDKEASLIREQTANLLTVFAGHKNENLLDRLIECNFADAAMTILTRFCYEAKKYKRFDSNIPIKMMEDPKRNDVFLAKNGKQRRTIISNTSLAPQITSGLVASMADLIHTLINTNSNFNNGFQHWTEQGLFRLFFRSLSVTAHDIESTVQLRASVCALLTRVMNISEETLGIIADTRDCINTLIQILIEDCDELTRSIEDLYKEEYLRHAYTLLGALCSNEKASLFIWNCLKDGPLNEFFRNCLVYLSDSHEVCDRDLQKSIFYCLSQLITSSPDQISYLEGVAMDAVSCSDVATEGHVAGWLSEELARVACERFKESCIRVQPHLLAQDDYWSHTQIFLSCLLSLSARAREWCCLASLAELITSLIVNIRNLLSMQTSNLDALRNKDRNAFIERQYRYHHFGMVLLEKKWRKKLYNILRIYSQRVQYFCLKHSHLDSSDSYLPILKINPTLQSLNALLVLSASHMRDCIKAKEIFSDMNFAVSLNKLWPWIMCTEPLRTNTVVMLGIFTNNCSKAWSQIYTCVSTGCLLGEICRLVSRDMSQPMRGKSLTIAAIGVLTNCVPHSHCRTYILKSEVMDSIEKLHPALTRKRSLPKSLEKAFEEFLERLSRYAEGQLKLSQYSSTLCALVQQNNGLMIRVLANLAYHYLNRAKILGSAEVLEIFSNILCADENEEGKLAVCRAIWALAANNHKAKLSLRASGIASRVRDLVARTPLKNEALTQILHYTYSVLTVV